MYCPRCSKEFQPEISYCRICGLSLEGVAEIVKGEAESEPDIRSEPNRKLHRIGIGVAVFGLFVGLGIALFVSLGLEAAAAVAKVLFILLLMTGMLITGAAFVFPQKRYVKKRQKVNANAEDGERLATGHLEQLPSADGGLDDFIFPADSREPDSITEHTTRQLR